MKKYFELEEDRLKDFLKKEECWVKGKKETEELKKRMVSRFWLEEENQLCADIFQIRHAACLVLHPSPNPNHLK